MVSEAADSDALDLDTAHAILSANFAFRTHADKRGARLYRVVPNATPIELVPGPPMPSVHYELPSSDSEFTPQGHPVMRRHRYGVQTVHELVTVLHVFLGRPPVVPQAAVDLPGPAGTTTNNTTNTRTALNPSIATNTILYGPPGTGKTYATASRAVQLCDGALPAEGSREAVLARYEALRKEGRITFVTFHQSYGYEEFVEGLRPRADATGQIVYGVLPGVFVRACDNAWPRASVPVARLQGRPLRERTIFKMSLGRSGTQEASLVFRHALDNGYVLLGWGEAVDFSDCKDEEAIGRRIAAQKPGMNRPESQAQFVNRFKHELKVGDLILVSHGNRLFRAIAEVSGEYEYVEDAPFQQARKVRWLAVFEEGRPVSDVFDGDFAMTSLYRPNPERIKYDALQALVSPTPQDPTPQAHVLVIDEINRANVSKVFGELITLIEPDKRRGAAEALTLKLPYSGDDFSVPSNLNILGTMNTADRSIALLDTALRRRFEFEELAPDPALLAGCVVEGIKLDRLLAALNDRIEALYDRDHAIGHAFLIGVHDLPALERVFRRKLLPLLQEYFHENWSQVRRVLRDVGEGDFIERRVLHGVPPDGEDGFEDEPRVSFRVRATPFPVSAYRRIYEGS